MIKQSNTMTDMMGWYFPAISLYISESKTQKSTHYELTYNQLHTLQKIMRIVTKNSISSAFTAFLHIKSTRLVCNLLHFSLKITLKWHFPFSLKSTIK